MLIIKGLLGASLFLVGTALEKTPHRVLVESALLIGIYWLNSGLFDLVADFTAPNWASLIIGVCVVLTAYGLQKRGGVSASIRAWLFLWFYHGL